MKRAIGALVAALLLILIFLADYHKLYIPGLSERLDQLPNIDEWFKQLPFPLPLPRQ